MLIDGEWRPAAGGRTLAVEDPATGEILVEVADGDATDALAALEAADRAQPGWAATPPRERGEILRRAFEALTANAGDLALLMTLEMGKPLAESRAEITYAAEFFRWYSEEAVRITRRLPGGAGRRQPPHRHAPARRPRPLHHPVELPDGHGHPQDRTGHRRRLHHGPQTGGASLRCRRWRWPRS